MRSYRQVTDVEPASAAFLEQHLERLGNELPAGLWVCEDDGEIKMALLVYTEPHVRVSIISDVASVHMLSRLAKTFEGWAKSHGVTSYAVVIEESDDAYRKILERRGAIEIARVDGWVEYLHQIDPVASLEDGIRPWAPADWTLLRPLLRAFLLEHHAAGGDFLGTRNNVEMFIRRGVQAAAKGDPALLAVQAGEVVGFCLWVGVAPLGLDMRESVCTGIGTFVKPEHRRQGWSKKIRERALEVAKAAGYARVDGVAIEKRGYEAGVSAGFSTAGVLVRRRLEN